VQAAQKVVTEWFAAVQAAQKTGGGDPPPESKCAAAQAVLESWLPMAPLGGAFAGALTLTPHYK